MKNLFNSLKAVGQEPILLQDKLMILPFGGRIVGLYPDRNNNVLWVNPELLSEKSAWAFFKTEGWLNIGGDRSWISPEVDTNIGDATRMAETYSVPKAMDPATYQLAKADEKSVQLETDMDLLFHRSSQGIKLKLSKQITILENPPVEVPQGVSAYGYDLNCTLKSASELSDGLRPGIWNIVQVPPNGEIILPVKEDAKPRAFIANPIFTSEKNLITCQVKSAESFKFSIRSRHCRGLMLYINTDTEPAIMVMRKFKVYNEDVYADVPCDDPTDTGYVQQVYVDDGALGGFGELEYHSPACVADKQNVVCDTSEVWGFSGPKKQIAAIKETILNQL